MIARYLIVFLWPHLKLLFHPIPNVQAILVIKNYIYYKNIMNFLAIDNNIALYFLFLFMNFIT